MMSLWENKTDIYDVIKCLLSNNPIKTIDYSTRWISSFYPYIRSVEHSSSNGILFFNVNTMVFNLPHWGILFDDFSKRVDHTVKERVS